MEYETKKIANFLWTVYRGWRLAMGPTALALILIAAPAARGQVIINTGIDTTLPSGTGLNGSDAPHGGAGTNPDGVERWEWDGSDGGGENLGLLWMDIPQSVLDDFAAAPAGLALLALHNDNEGDSGNAHRITVDWLSGPTGGDEVTFNNMPGGPGIIPGVNAREEISFSTGFMCCGEVYEFDATADVLAWASGEPNYGWGFLPTAGNGNGITSFESEINPVPTLTLFTSDGDFNGDGSVDLTDFGILADNFNTDAGVDAGDMTFDGHVDIGDFIAFKKAFDSAGGAAAAVPEPSAGLLISGGLALLSMVRRRNRR